MTFGLPKPVRLMAAVAAAIESHPYSVNGSLIPSARLDSDSTAIWQRLISADDNARARIIDTLSALEVRILLATARQRIGVNSVPDILAAILHRHSPDGALSFAWDFFLLTDGHADFRMLAREFAQAHAAAHPGWIRLTDDGRPSDAARALYDAQSDTFENWVESRAPSLNRWPDLVKRLRACLLASENVARLDRRESSELIDQWAKTTIPSVDKEPWYATFLDTTAHNKRPLNHAVFQTILERFGEPSSANAFWSAVTDSGKTAFQHWLMETRLTQLLGEGERVDFWRRFLPQITRVFGKKQNRVVYIDLGSVIAVQFVDTGTATYLFDRNTFRHVSRGIEKEVRKSVYGNSPKSLGSYEHRGNSWQLTAERHVREVMRNVSDA